ncbi:MAG: KpsF/GutQ family sugar-phosphate isomerase [Rhodospirillaceae bacterium]|jgi:arabinose-5-phosphate isomerase|nr:KpsF/GutQ family sugar-phosphate isomerase [Rhodospirillaceae bacterium]
MSALTHATPAKTDTDPSQSDLGVARRVLAQAGTGLVMMASELGEEFIQCVSLIAGLEGRLIVSGMGKSGHIGQKIAATLASTGTPAFFVHPAEASHGDLGMISDGDAVLALSNSGETLELSDLVSYTRRFGIPLIGMTGKCQSALAEQSDIVLALPEVGEAGPHGAPTTSTTLMITLGDAIAVALLERRGFTADDYRVFHPGGKLGKGLLKVADIMHTDSEIPLARPDAPMSETILTMTEKTFGTAGVVDDAGQLIGIVTDGDLRRHMAEKMIGMTTSEVMTTAPKTIGPSILAAEALRLMNEWKVTCLFAVDAGKPVGILRMHDILRAGVV